MNRIDIIKSEAYWKEALEGFQYNDFTNEQIAKDIAEKVKEAFDLGNVSESSYSLQESDKFKYCNHHHELTPNHTIIDFGDGEFVANKLAVPLLKALNLIGLKTRTHHIDENEHAFISILLDNVEFDFKTVNEIDSSRTKHNGKKELLIRWRK